MRNYAKLAPGLYVGELAIKIRGDTRSLSEEGSASSGDCWAVAQYLIGSPHGNAIGIYRLPISYIEEDLGIPSARACEALRKLSLWGFCWYDDEWQVVWVIEHARHEWGESLDLRDNQVKKLAKMLPQLVARVCKSNLFMEFERRYREGWGEIFDAAGKPFGSPSEALRKPFGSPSALVPNQDQEQEQEQERRGTTSLVGDPKRSTDDGPGAPSKNGRVAEISWRIEKVWEAHLKMREYHWRDVEIEDKPPGAPPALTPERRKLIAAALKKHDGELLGGEDREAWERDSRVRAAAVGLFLSPWHNGTDPENKVGAGGKRYLEPERAWKQLKGIDPVDRFAELYFDRRQKQERRQT